MYLSLIVVYGVDRAGYGGTAWEQLAGNALAGYVTRFDGCWASKEFRIVPIAIIVQVVIAFVIPLGAGFHSQSTEVQKRVFARAISNYRPGNLQSASRSFTQPQWSLGGLDFTSHPFVLPQYLSKERAAWF